MLNREFRIMKSELRITTTKAQQNCCRFNMKNVKRNTKWRIISTNKNVQMLFAIHCLAQACIDFLI
jgi:hypothetical protein